MKNGIWFLGLPMCILALGALLANCENPANADKWSPVTSLSQLDGTWEYSYTETQPLAEWVEDFGEIYGDGLELPLEAQIILGTMSGVEVTVEVEGTQTIDAHANPSTLSGSTTTTMTFSGGNANGVYFMLRMYMSQMSGELGEYIGNIPDIRFNDSKKSMTMTYDFGPEPMDDDDMGMILSQLQINQDGKKIKIQGPDSRDIIAIKQ